MLVEGPAVELRECELVLREVSGNPVHDDADTGLVQPVDQVLEVVGAAESARGCEVTRDLIAPGSAERMLREGEELHVGEAKRAHVFDQRVGCVAVRQAGAPRAEVDLVDRHGLGHRATLGTS